MLFNVCNKNYPRKPSRYDIKSDFCGYITKLKIYNY